MFLSFHLLKTRLTPWGTTQAQHGQRHGWPRARRPPERPDGSVSLFHRLTRHHRTRDTSHRSEGKADQEAEPEADPGPPGSPSPGSLLHEMDVATEPPATRLRGRRAATWRRVRPNGLRGRRAASSSEARRGRQSSRARCRLLDGCWLHVLVRRDPGREDWTAGLENPSGINDFLREYDLLELTREEVEKLAQTGAQ